MTLDEMRQQLQMSKPSMSSGVKKLQEYDIVKQQFNAEVVSNILSQRKTSLISSETSLQENGNERSILTWRQLKMPKRSSTHY